MKVAVVGTGKIVHQVLPDLLAVPNVKAQVIVARPHSLEKAEQLAKDYQVPEVSTNYDAVLSRDDIDFIYIGIVNTAHFEYAKRALEAGKNVICEKPLVPTYAEAKELADLAEANHLYLFEAVAMLHTPNYHIMEENISRLGRIRLIQSDYSQYSSRYDNYKKGIVQPAFDPAIRGGALYDINVYNIHYIVNLFGEPTSVHYEANVGFNGVDTSGILTLRYPDFVAVCVGAKDSASPSYQIIQGEDGFLQTKGDVGKLKTLEIHADGDVEYHVNEGYPDRLCWEFEEFEKLYTAGNYEKMRQYLNASLIVANILETAYNQIPPIQ